MYLPYCWQRKVEGLIDEDEKPLQKKSQDRSLFEPNSQSTLKVASTSPGAFNRDLSFHQEFRLIGGVEFDPGPSQPASVTFYCIFVLPSRVIGPNCTQQEGKIPRCKCRSTSRTFYLTREATARSSKAEQRDMCFGESNHC